MGSGKKGCETSINSEAFVILVLFILLVIILF